MNRKFIITLMAGLAALVSLSSCNDSKDDNLALMQPTALVTVRPQGDSFVMRLDEKVRLHPTNVTKSPYGDKEVRALVNYKVEAVNGNDQDVYVHWLDSIRTKAPVASLGELNDDTYGNDPFEIVRDWVTIAEDGYLTLRTRTRWGGPCHPHYMNLLTGVNPSDPYEFEIRHDADGDLGGVVGDALIAFDLRKIFEAEPAGTVEFKIRWMSYSGEKSAVFKMVLPESSERSL